MYLVSQILLLLIGAALLGGVLGWLVRGLRADRDMQILQSEHERLDALAQEQAGQARAQLREAEARLSETNDELGAVRSEALQQREEMEEVRSRLASTAAEGDRLRQAARNREAELEAARAQIAALQLSVAAATAEHEKTRSALSSERDAAVSERDAARDERDAAVGERDVAQSDRDGARQRGDDLAEQVDRLKAVLDEFEARSVRAEEAAERAAHRSREHESTRSELEARLAARGEEVRRLSEELEALKQPTDGRPATPRGDGPGSDQAGNHPVGWSVAGPKGARRRSAGAVTLDRAESSGKGLSHRGGPTAGTSDSQDLKRIKGVGPRLEQRLNELGIFRFEQLASLTPDEVEWLSVQLGSFPDRIRRENWIGQAAALDAESPIIGTEAGV